MPPRRPAHVLRGSRSGARTVRRSRREPGQGDHERSKGVGTLRAMSPEEPADDRAPEPDDAPSGPPPDPLDRAWVHPTELSSFVAAPVLPARETRPREWVIGVSSTVVAVLATVLVLVAFGAL